MKYKSMTREALNSPLHSLSRLAGEIARTRKRLCIRKASAEVNYCLKLAEAHVDDAIELQMKLEAPK